MPQPSSNCLLTRRTIFVAIMLISWGLPVAAATESCSAALGAATFTQLLLKTHGLDPVTVHFDVRPGNPYLVQVEERGNDALVEVLDATGEMLARADHPERRTGTRRAVVAGPQSASLTVRVTGKEHANAAGTAFIRLSDLATLQAPSDCLVIANTLAAADADYAAGEEISRGRGTSATVSARAAFLQAVARYSAAERALAAPADQTLRGEVALALAGVEYVDLQDWAQTEVWAQVSAGALASADPYRRARAEALVAAAWIEMGSSGAAARQPAGHGASSSERLRRARVMLQRLNRFHLQRGERYDAALQLTNVAVTYLYEGRYADCVAESQASSALFGSLHEMQRRAQAWQNQALCLWGLGRLPEALQWFDRALTDLGPGPYQGTYVAGMFNNTALANFALGRFDESLRLFDRALAFTEEIQARRDEAQSLYGIGVNYYALGDRERAREFLERSLAMRSAAVDGRGRMSTLRALATIYAEQGSIGDALAFDREALGLAIAPSAVMRIRIQLAAHTAAGGRAVEALAQLDDILAQAAATDPLIRAEALLQRAELLRQLGRPQPALADLMAARQGLRLAGTVTEEFESQLELARTLQLMGRSTAALTAVNRALKLSDAVRRQTANPEFRAQLQAPLRPAYDLKLALLRERYEYALANGHGDEANALAAAAFATADASRAHSLADVAAQSYPPTVQRALAAELRRREDIYRQLSGRRFALDERLDHSGSDDPRAEHLMHDVVELERQADTLNSLIATRVMSAGEATRHKGGSSEVPKLPADTVLISYWLGSPSAYAWVASPAALHWERLSSPGLIAQRVTAFHRSLTRLVDVPVEQRLQEARALYGLIVRPIEPWLADARQWLVIPDGALDYVPFAALRGSKDDSFVAVRHDVALGPAAWILDRRTDPGQQRDRRGLLLVADPVYQPDDPRLAQVPKTDATTPAPSRRAPDPAVRDYQRIAFTAQEAAHIRAEFAPADVDQLIGLDATRQRLLAVDLSRYRFIHIATHGVVDAQVPQLSALILGSYDAHGHIVDGAVRVADLSLQTLTADVAVLSACDTALGKQVLSEGLAGIGSTMLARGARAVVASLWPVSDEMGARLMTEFYRHLLRDSMSAPAALGAAMRSVVSSDGSADPALWAAFQVSVVALAPGLPSGTSGTGKITTMRRPWESP